MPVDARVEGLDQGHFAGVVADQGTQLVEGVAEGDAVLRVGGAGGAAEAVVAEGRRVRAEAAGVAAEVETQSPLVREAEDRVDLLALALPRPGQGRRGQQ